MRGHSNHKLAAPKRQRFQLTEASATAWTGRPAGASVPGGKERRPLRTARQGTAREGSRPGGGQPWEHGPQGHCHGAEWLGKSEDDDKEAERDLQLGGSGAAFRAMGGA